MRIKELVEMLGCEVRTSGDATSALEAELGEVTADSRAVAGLAAPVHGGASGKGGVLFAALPGEHADGIDYAPRAMEAGAVAVLTPRAIDALACTQLIVPDVRGALADAASAIYGRPSEKLGMAAITGTNGKTTISYLLESIFRTAGHAPGVIGTINYRYGDNTYPAPHTTPEAPDLQRLLAEMKASGVTHCAMEVSSHALAQDRTRGVAFDVAVFTNLTHEHLDYHVTMEDYYRAKAQLFTRHMKPGGVAVINVDDEWGRRLAHNLDASDDPPELCLVSLSANKDADVYPESYRLHSGGIEAELLVDGARVTVTSALVGEYNLQNIMQAAAAALAMGVGVTDISLGIAALTRVPGRLEPVSGCDGFTAYVDYAHTADALGRAIGALRGISRGRVITVFGCGGDRDRTKRPEMAEVAARLSDVTIVTTDNPRSEDPVEILSEVEAGFAGTKARRCDDVSEMASGRGLYSVEVDRAEAIRKAVAIANKGDAVLVAGKGHEDYQIVGDKRLFFSDMEAIREAIAPCLEPADERQSVC